MTYRYSNRQEDQIISIFKVFADSIKDKVKVDTKALFNILDIKYQIDDIGYDNSKLSALIMNYFEKTVVPHKIAVFNAGYDLVHKDLLINNYFNKDEAEAFIENLVIHDLSKFSANEAFGYAMYDRKTGSGKETFEKAWHHHKMNNPHHPEHWFNPDRSGNLEPIPMPPIYVMEMIADWIGAGKTYGSTLEQWLPDNLPKFKFGASKSIVQNILGDLGIRTWIHEGNVLKTTEA